MKQDEYKHNLDLKWWKVLFKWSCQEENLSSSFHVYKSNCIQSRFIELPTYQAQIYMCAYIYIFDNLYAPLGNSVVHVHMFIHVLHHTRSMHLLFCLS